MIKKTFSIWGIFILFTFLHLISYFNNSVPLGYDAGEYLYIFKIFPDLPNWLTTGFSPGLFAFVYPLIRSGISPESLLIPLSILSQIVLFFSVYFASKKMFGEKTAFFTAFILIISAIQFRTFWFFYVKNTFAISFLILSLYFLYKKSFLRVVIFGFLVGIFHLPTFLIFFLVVIVQIVFDYEKRFFYAKVFFLVLMLESFYYLPNFKLAILPFLAPILKSSAPVQIILGQGMSGAAGGSFYSLPVSLLLIVSYVPFAFFGFYKIIKAKNWSLNPFVSGFVITFLIIFTRSFFFNRFFIILDIFLIFFAGIGISFLFEKYKENKENLNFLKFYLAVLVLFILVFILKTGQPLISKSMLEEMKYLSLQNKSGFILSTSKEDNAWLLGYTDLNLIAWNYGGYDKYWNNLMWQKFFSTKSLDERIKLLKLLPSPLYIFINDKSINIFSNLQESSCFEQQTFHVYKFKCNSGN